MIKGQPAIDYFEHEGRDHGPKNVGSVYRLDMAKK
jgi:hypothetical protein